MSHLRSPVRRYMRAQHAAEHEPAQGGDGQRHVDVEDLLDEALVGVQRGVEEDQREGDGDREDGG